MSSGPRVSVIVTTYNRPRKLARLLEALCRQSYPADSFEVVVVDDGSREPVAAIVDGFAGRLHCVLHRQENSGPAVGRNQAMGLARGRFVAMVDDDCEPAAPWLAHLMAALETDPESMAGGHTDNGLPENLYSTVSQMIVDRVYAVHNANPMAAGFFTSSNLAASRDALLQPGGFDPHYRYAGGEDRGLSDRWRHSGRPMIYIPQARVLHFHDLSLWSFLRQHFNYGRGALVYHQSRQTKTREEARTAQGIVFDWGAWGRAIAAQQGRHNAAAIVSLLVLWQGANAAGYFWELAVRGTRLAATGRTGSARRR